MTVAATTRRLAKPDRRQQLLDVAAGLLTRSGTAGITMERVAEHAGVSKALPYQHFTNADDLLRALHTREVTHLGARVAAAVQAATGGEARLRAAVAAYFDVIAERGVLLGILGRHDTTADQPPVADGQQFVADLLTTTYRINHSQAFVLAEMILGALLGAVAAWGRGDASRRSVETIAADAVVAMLGGASPADPPPGDQHRSAQLEAP